MASIFLNRTYLFIDGAYLKKSYKDAMRRFLGLEGELDYRALRIDVAEASRAFFYDCLDEERRDNESDVQSMSTQKAELDSIQASSGFHVRYGKLAGGRPRRQKQVDISIAVDMLDHAARGNMSRVVLFAGDSDFVPLVHAVVRHGVEVEIFYDGGSFSKDLLDEADARREFDFEQYYQRITKPSFRSQHPLPMFGQVVSGPPNYPRIGIGTVGVTAFEMYRMEQRYLFYGNNGQSQASHNELSEFTHYLEAKMGTLTWELKPTELIN